MTIKHQSSSSLKHFSGNLVIEHKTHRSHQGSHNGIAWLVAQPPMGFQAADRLARRATSADLRASRRPTGSDVEPLRRICGVPGDRPARLESHFSGFTGFPETHRLGCRATSAGLRASRRPTGSPEEPLRLGWSPPRQSPSITCSLVG